MLRVLFPGALKRSFSRTSKGHWQGIRAQLAMLRSYLKEYCVWSRKSRTNSKDVLVLYTSNDA